MRIGMGYDVHRLTEDRKLILGGVEIPYEKGLLGHSDADVLTHSIIDALLGACALGDIGNSFPDSDDAYKGISSIVLLMRTTELIKSYGFTPVNVDVTLIAQKPKLAAYRDEMRRRLAEAMSITIEQVSVKFTTPEHLGAEGRLEGMSARAVALVSSITES